MAPHYQTMRADVFCRLGSPKWIFIGDRVYLVRFLKEWTHNVSDTETRTRYILGLIGVSCPDTVMIALHDTELIIYDVCPIEINGQTPHHDDFDFDHSVTVTSSGTGPCEFYMGPSLHDVYDDIFVAMHNEEDNIDLTYQQFSDLSTRYEKKLYLDKLMNAQGISSIDI